jgi:hypothetical protein
MKQTVIHLQQMTTPAPEQYVARPSHSKLFGNSGDEDQTEAI